MLLVATPLAALATHNPLPPAFIGSVAFAVIGTGVAARQMLMACTLTYVASSLAAALQLWPWISRITMMMTPAMVSAPTVPTAIVRDLELRELPARSKGGFYQRLAVYGHMGRTDLDAPWEKTDKADELK